MGKGKAAPLRTGPWRAIGTARRRDTALADDSAPCTSCGTSRRRWVAGQGHCTCTRPSQPRTARGRTFAPRAQTQMRIGRTRSRTSEGCTPTRTLVDRNPTCAPLSACRAKTGVAQQMSEGRLDKSHSHSYWGSTRSSMCTAPPGRTGCARVEDRKRERGALSVRFSGSL